MWNNCTLAGVTIHVTPHLKLRVLHNKLVLCCIVFQIDTLTYWVLCYEQSLILHCVKRFNNKLLLPSILEPVPVVLVYMKY